MRNLCRQKPDALTKPGRAPNGEKGGIRGAETAGGLRNVGNGRAGRFTSR